jgi:hypothetical protein
MVWKSKIESLPTPTTAPRSGPTYHLAIAGQTHDPRGLTGDAKTVKELKGHGGRIHALAFAPKDGTRCFRHRPTRPPSLGHQSGKALRDFSGHGDGVPA